MHLIQVYLIRILEWTMRLMLLGIYVCNNLTLPNQRHWAKLRLEYTKIPFLLMPYHTGMKKKKKKKKGGKKRSECTC